MSFRYKEIRVAKLYQYCGTFLRTHVIIPVCVV